MKPQERTRAILKSKAEPSMRLLLVAIADHMNEADQSWPSPSLLSEETGLAESTVMELIKEAVALGVLRRWQGDYRWKIMAIQWEALAAITPKAATRGGKRKPPTSGDDAPTNGDSPPIIGGSEHSDNRCPPLRSSVPSPPIIGAQGSDNRTRSDHEPAREPAMEQPNARAREGVPGPVTVGGRELPGTLPALLSAGPGSPNGCTRIGRVDVVERLLRVPIETTEALLRTPRSAWYGDDGRCFVPGCSTAFRDALDDHLRTRWGVQLGLLAPFAPKARGDPKREALEQHLRGDGMGDRVLAGEFDDGWRRDLGWSEEQIEAEKSKWRRAG